MLRAVPRALLMLLLLAPLPAAADVFMDIRERGGVRIGVADFVPWTFETSDGELRGFEIDIGKRIAQDLGVEPLFEIYPWEDIIPALLDGEIDMIAAGMAITPARALDVAFTQPYFASGVAIATNIELTSEINSLAELDSGEVVVATVTETLAFDFAERFFNEARVLVFDGSDAAEQAVLDGDAHVYLASLPEARYLALANPQVIDLPLAEPLLDSRAGFAVRQGEQNWLNFLNAWIVAREADRFLATAHAYWFESLDWASDVTER